MMNSSKKYDFITNEIILDWYDGVVSGIFKNEATKQWFFCNLLSFDLSTQIKIYSVLLLLPVMIHDFFNMFNSEKIESPIRNMYLLSDEQKNQLDEILKLSYNKTNNIDLIKTRSIGEMPIEIQNVNKDSIPIELFYWSIDEVFLEGNDKKQVWNN